MRVGLMIRFKTDLVGLRVGGGQSKLYPEVWERMGLRVPSEVELQIFVQRECGSKRVEVNIFREE